MSKRSASYGNAHKRSRLSAPRVTLVTGYNRATGGLTANARGKSLNRAVAAAVRKTVEKKGVDTPLTIAGPVLATTNTNADCIVLNLVQQGAGSWNRIGRKINLQSVRLRGMAVFIYDNQVTLGTLQGNVLRMVVVWDKQPSGASIPTFDTVFGKTDQNGTEQTNFLDPVKYDNMDRFSVLRDCVMDAKPQVEVPTASGSLPGAIVRVPFDEFIPLKNRECVFLGQSTPMTIADISTGAMYVYFRAAVANNDTSDWSIDATSFARLRYVDI